MDRELEWCDGRFAAPFGYLQSSTPYLGLCTPDFQAGSGEILAPLGFESEIVLVGSFAINTKWNLEVAAETALGELRTHQLVGIETWKWRRRHGLLCCVDDILD